MTTSPAYLVPSTIYHKIPSYISPNMNNKVQGSEGPPLDKEHIHFHASIPRTTLIRTEQQLHPEAAINAAHYWLHNYIGTLQYCFKFIVNNDHRNLASTGVILSNLRIHIE